jgi:inorganic phosphate transporter, PiT family
MLSIVPASPLAIGLLVFCLVLVLAFEFANGFHDTANAVATVIYTNSMRPKPAAILSGIMNFIGVAVGGISVAYALVELLPPDVLSPPDGSPAVPMLVAVFATALAWNVLTWAFGIPNSSSHCIIGSLIGVAVGDALITARPMDGTVDWSQVWNVLRALAISPILGLVGAGLLYFVVRRLIRDPHLYEPPRDGKPPARWVRSLLILTCTSVSFSHGTNDGQKSIGLIMLTIIGLMPAQYALNPMAQDGIAQLAEHVRNAEPLIRQFGDDEKNRAMQAVARLQQMRPEQFAANVPPGNATDASMPAIQPSKSAIRDDVYRVVSELKVAGSNKAASKAERASATKLRQAISPVVEYAPWWVRILSAVCLGLGTMIGYRRVVLTLGERLGTTHLTPAQGASAELVGAGLIATAGFTGLPVSTTHIITSGIAGTMFGSGSSVNRGVVMRILAAWVFTLPITVAVAAGLFYMLDS